MTTEKTELETLAAINLKLKHKRQTDPNWDAEAEIRQALQDSKYRAVTVLFSDIEGRLHRRNSSSCR